MRSTPELGCMTCGNRPCRCPYDPARRISFLSDSVKMADWLEARSIARERTPVERGDGARWQHDAERIRRALALPSYRNHTIEMSCFNDEDERGIRARLTQDEQLRVRFTR